MFACRRCALIFQASLQLSGRKLLDRAAKLYAEHVLLDRMGVLISAIVFFKDVKKCHRKTCPKSGLPTGGGV